MKTYVCYLYQRPRVVKIKARSKAEAEKKLRELYGEHIKALIKQVWV